MANKLLIMGARERPNGFDLGDGKMYGCAVLLRVDLATSQVEVLLEMDEANENYPEEFPNLQFTAGCSSGDIIWLPTDTEILAVRYPSLRMEKRISHPCFQNIHSVTQCDGLLWVTSTGLDMVVALDPATGEIVDRWNAEHKPVWHRFSESTDYRKVHSTRPHDCHPNFIFKHKDEYWVTRCKQEDAVTLFGGNGRIDISGAKKPISVHDGVVKDDLIYFTSVDGCLVIADPQKEEVIESIDICEEQNLGRIGWCRGLHLDGDTAYLGFSSIRRTRQAGKLAWLGSRLSNLAGTQPCIIAYDMRLRKILTRITLTDHVIDAIYGILPVPDCG